MKTHISQKMEKEKIANISICMLYVVGLSICIQLLFGFKFELRHKMASFTAFFFQGVI